MKRFTRSFKSICMALAPLLTVAGCGGSDDSSTMSGAPMPMTMVSQAITARSGGSVSFPGGAVTAMIPADALNQDTMVTIERINGETAAVSAPLSANGDIYTVSLGSGAVLSQPMVLRMMAAAVPQRPQLGEIAQLTNGTWVRLSANFYRSSDNSVVALTTMPGSFRVVNRMLQAVTGASVERGKDVFLHETFGNEAFFGGVLKLQDVLNNVKPADAVALGVQVDLNKVPASIVAVLTGGDYAAKQSALQDAAVTRALIKAGAVIGVKGVYADANSDVMTGAGITCALCHVTVAPTQFQLAADGSKTSLPIGPINLDGVPNAAMDAGKILSLTATVQSLGATDLLAHWGPGKFDIRALPDNPLDDGANNPTQTPPLWNFVDLEAQGYAYDWDALFFSKTKMPDNSLASQAEAVYDLVMHANGAFGIPNVGNLPPELRVTPPQSLVDGLIAAEAASPGNVIDTQKLLDVQDFERSIVSPAPEVFDEELAQQGFMLFNDSTKGNCASCHSSAEFTGPTIAHITPTMFGGALANGIKTPGLRGIGKTAPYFADGSAATLEDAVKLYVDQGIVNPLTDAEQAAIAEYLKSL